MLNHHSFKDPTSVLCSDSTILRTSEYLSIFVYPMCGSNRLTYSAPQRVHKASEKVTYEKLIWLTQLSGIPYCSIQTPFYSYNNMPEISYDQQVFSILYQLGRRLSST